MKFITGKTYGTRSIGDHDCIFKGTVMKRTAKTVTINCQHEIAKRCKIHHDEDGDEFIFPFGRYSMAPIFRASRLAS